MKFTLGIITLSLLIILVSCTSAAQTRLPTPLPEAYLPTATNLTSQTSGVGLQKPSPTQPAAARSSTSDSQLLPSSTPAPSPTPVILPATAKPFSSPFLPLPTDTLPPNIPEAPIQITHIGELSKVASPIPIYALLTSQTGKTARVELYGEDGGLLARYVKKFNMNPWKSNTVDMDVDFEIEANTEKGRLVISVADEFGRLTDLSSVELILLSKGASKLNPPLSILQTIVIQQPQPEDRLQGGVVRVTGLALPGADSQLKMELIDEKGNKLGQRLARIDPTSPGGYGRFVAEVPFQVSEPTPARLIVYQDGGNISPLTHLSSVEILLSP